GPDTVALVFYAGHGIQVDGENFLVPVDIDPRREADIPMQAVRLNDILNTLASVPSRMRFLLLDACRNNPFPDLGKSTGSGLAIVDAK
ncbi:caspase family protein, partial [Acinetobacter baumannii]